MSIDLEQALRNAARKRIEIERRLRYNMNTGEIIDWCHVDKDQTWPDPYIVIGDETLVYPIRQRVRDGKLVDIDTAAHVYWHATPAQTLENNPYFCIREINDEE